MPALLQPDPHGPALGVHRDARYQASQTIRQPPSVALARHGLGQLPARARRYRLVLRQWRRLGVGINPDDHRNFLNRFYTGAFKGSFAAGVPFQHNSDTGDMRVSGTMASLAGLEQALVSEDPVLLEMALRRIRMLYGVLCSIGGIPLIFLGEEWGILNDYNYLGDKEKKDDSRWVHRPMMDWSLLGELDDESSPRARIFREMQAVFATRKTCPALTNSQMRLLSTENIHVMSYLRWNEGYLLVVVANFSDAPQQVNMRKLRTEGLAHFFKDQLSERTVSSHDFFELEPYELLWLEED